MIAARLALAVALLLGCSDDEQDSSTPAARGSGNATSLAGSGSVDASGGTAGAGMLTGGSGGSAGTGGSADTGGTAGAGDSANAGGSAGSEGYCSADRAGSAADADRVAPPAPSDPQMVEVTLDPCTLEVISLPINSVRTAASGYDPAARICASIIWDFSNNDIPSERYCGDFLVPANDGGFTERVGFPYVVLRREQDAPCRNLWEYGGTEPLSASGCIDPVEDRVDAVVEADLDGVHYLIRARSLPTDLTP